MGFREDVRQQDLRLLGSVSGVTVVTPIVYGNVARYFGQKREEDGHTRQRTVYIKPYRNEEQNERSSASYSVLLSSVERDHGKPQYHHSEQCQGSTVEQTINCSYASLN
ncbi:YEATS domain-containing protein 4-like isoform X1 [Loxodonta africana]|uniref:YEATS domain-containing protein 4-like isoform X1 n=1 Tax=Loxodonta africana TaxID=9785 RepID=UPI0030CDAC0E